MNRSELDGEGAAWAMTGLLSSLVVGALVEPFRDRIGLENIVILYLAIVIVCAAIGGRGAGLVSALAAALSYNFFFTSPYYSLRVSSAEQVLTILLLFAAGVIAAVFGRSRRRAKATEEQEEAAIELFEAVAKAAAEGGTADRVAVEGVRAMLDARLVQVRRDGRVTAAAGEADAPDPAALTRLDPDGRMPPGTKLRVRAGGIALPVPGIVLPMARAGTEVGALVVVPGPDRGLARTVRVALAGVAHLLAAGG
jgi:K+-sensing histidine kinase KdpD